MIKSTKWPVRPAKTQICLGICPIWSVFAVRMKKHWALNYLLSTQWRLWSDWGMARLIWVFAGHTCHFVGFVMRQLIWPCIFAYMKMLYINKNWHKECWVTLWNGVQSYHTFLGNERLVFKISFSRQQAECSSIHVKHLSILIESSLETCTYMKYVCRIISKRNEIWGYMYVCISYINFVIVEGLLPTVFQRPPTPSVQKK